MPPRNALQITTLLDAIETNKVDCAIGGGRSDEEKARAKERFFSHRDDFGQWDPKNQRPELWNLFNGKYFEGEHFRVFPISNWTEMDVWNYIKREKIAIPSSIPSTRTRSGVEKQFLDSAFRIPDNWKNGKNRNQKNQVPYFGRYYDHRGYRI